MIRQLVRAAAVAVAASLAPALAQDFPSHPVKIVSPYPPGGTTDILARLLSPKLSAALGQPVVVDNKAGASGNIGTEFVARANPDGHTLLMGNNTGVVINRNLYKLNVDPPQALVPVILVAQVPTVLYVHPSVPAASVQEFVALVRKSPGKYSFASAGSGSPQHLAGEMLKAAFDLDMVHIPYKGSGPAITDVVAGQVPVGFESTVVLQPFVESGRARPLATTGAVRSISLPNVPTMMESGAKDFDVTNWYGLFAPAGTPREVVERINAEVRKIMEAPEVKERLAKMGSAVVPGTADEFARFVKAEVPRAAELVKKSGAKVD
ncbi:MAG: tripartite tricarboxylate transporter substrate binding protein [Betaproteobacteria bacterium]|nr:tripartite tricarboxylate transporter substrate binding protein [Betaproteobacteria bacterium]PWB64196.1 MAG: tricarboxylate-binding receptor [Betaproteobacteria bacterium]